MLDLLKAKSVLYIKLAVKGLYRGQKKKKIKIRIKEEVELKEQLLAP